jgi:hypothetical protein
MFNAGGRALIGLGPFTGYQTQLNYECLYFRVWESDYVR